MVSSSGQFPRQKGFLQKTNLPFLMVSSNFISVFLFVFTGNHYWYNISQNMDCKDFFPVFLLYNGGKLNAFGWAIGGDAQDKNFEHPEKAYLKVIHFLIPSNISDY